MQEILLKITYFKRGLLKTFEIVNFIFFLLNPVPFNGQLLSKGPRTSDQLLFMLQNKFTKFIY